MFCRYFDNNRHPKFVIAPVKEEDEWDRPHILRYHDIVSDAEIELVKQLAKPRVSARLTSYLYSHDIERRVCTSREPFLSSGSLLT